MADPANKQTKLIEAIVAETVACGYEGLTVHGICARAGLSRPSFDARFPDLREAVEAAHEQVLERFMDRLLGACKVQSEWPLKVKVGIAVALDLAASHPLHARFLFIDSLAADRDVARLGIDARDRLAGILAEVRAQSSLPRKLPRLTEEVLVGGLLATVSARLIRGEGEQLPSMVSELVEFTLRFYLSPEEAVRVATGSKIW